MRTRHHIIPKSRGGDRSRRNIAYLTRREHQMYHALFENRTPKEILYYLNSYFWNDRYRGLDRVVEE
jgi:hypothetical protein